MTPRAIAAVALLVLGVGIELACCVGVLVMRGVYDKLHYTAPASTLGALAIAGAVLLRESIVQYGLKAILITLALLIRIALSQGLAHPPLRRLDRAGRGGGRGGGDRCGATMTEAGDQ